MAAGFLRQLDSWSWAIFFVRWVLGLIFFMAGWWKVFEMGPKMHAQRFFIDGFSETWIPIWFLWAVGFLIPFAELLAGGLMCLGLRIREASIVLGLILIAVTYGHLLLEALYDTTSHIFPRLVLLTFVLCAPGERDLLSLDRVFTKRSDT